MTISAFPTPTPSRSQDQDTFDSAVEAFLTHLPTFVSEANAVAVAMNLNSTIDTSTSSVAIGTGAKTFTVTAGKSFQPGMWLVIADTAAPTTNAMFAQVTSYSGTTLVVNSYAVMGSGTKTAWVISQSAPAALEGLYALVAGSATQAFSVAAATAAAHAVRKDQLDAATGHLGEVIESVVSAVDAPTSGQYGDLTSINLSVGTWDVGTNVLCLSNGATVTACVGGIGTATGNSSTGLVSGDTSSEFLPPTAASASSGSVSPKRYIIAAPTTLYLKMFANYTVATPKFYGRITAERVAL